MKLKISICHYPPLVERKKYLDSVLPAFNIPYEFFSRFNRNNIEKYETYFSTDKTIIEHKNKYTPYPCNDPLTSSSVKAVNLEHLHIYRDIAASNLDAGLIIEDDAIFVPDFACRLLDMLEQLPSDYDVVYMNSGCTGRENLIREAKLINEPVNGYIKMPKRISWTCCGYLLKKETAANFDKNILPMTLPIDFELNYLQGYLKSNVYWLEVPLIYDGSNPGSNEYFRYPSSTRDRT